MPNTTLANLHIQSHQIGSVTLIFHGNLKCIESITEKGTHLKINLSPDYAEENLCGYNIANADM